MVFVPNFTDPANPCLERVADHIDYIGQRCGKAHVGISSDFGQFTQLSYTHTWTIVADGADGIDFAVNGLEDATKYPDLIAEMIRRGWSDSEVIALMGGNIMRVMDEVDEVTKQMAAQGLGPSPAIFEGRTDLPMDKEDDLPEVVVKYLRDKTKKGTLPPGIRSLP